MDKKIIKMAADLMKELGLTEIKLRDGDTEVEMKREAQAAESSSPLSRPLIPTEEQHDTNTYTDVLSPLIGVFHSSPNGSAEPFVSLGTKVKKGDTLCLVESMKMINEIKSEYNGIITNIFVTDDTLVEYGNPLFRISH